MAFALISYDISDNRRRAKVARYLLDFGQRVQYSVFEVSEKKQTIEEIFAHLQTLILPESDSIRIYILCRSCQDEIKSLGKGRDYELDAPYFII